MINITADAMILEYKSDAPRVLDMMIEHAIGGKRHDEALELDRVRRAVVLKLTGGGPASLPPPDAREPKSRKDGLPGPGPHPMHRDVPPRAESIVKDACNKMSKSVDGSRNAD